MLFVAWYWTFVPFVVFTVIGFMSAQITYQRNLRYREGIEGNYGIGSAAINGDEQGSTVQAAPSQIHNDVRNEITNDITDFRQCLANAERGDADAQYDLAMMYAEGIVVPEDFTKAAKWCRLAAEQDQVRAQYKLGGMYDLGEGVPEDVFQALKWYQMAAEGGDEDAQFVLGEMYATDLRIERNHNESLKWYRLAAEQGHEEAEERLARIARRDKSSL